MKVSKRIGLRASVQKGVALAQTAFVMKKYHIHTKADDILHRFPVLSKRLAVITTVLAQSGAPRVLGLGLDLEKAGACVAIQAGLCEPVQLGTLSRTEILQLLQALKIQDWRRVVAVEACGFGWAFQRAMRTTEAEVFTFATEALTGRRKTNRRDAAALARLVIDRAVYGNQEAGRIVREPSPDEQQERYLSRHRAQLVALRGKIEGQGRGLLYDFGQIDFPEC